MSAIDTTTTPRNAKTLWAANNSGYPSIGFIIRKCRVYTALVVNSIDSRGLKARDAARVASEAAGETISEAVFRAAMHRAKDDPRFTARRGADGGPEWSYAAAWEFGLSRRPEPVATQEEALAWGREQGLLTIEQVAAEASEAAGRLVTVVAVKVAVSDKTINNKAPNPKQDSEIPPRYRKWTWFPAEPARAWIKARPGRGNRDSKKVDSTKLGPDEWTARDCARHCGFANAGAWHRHVRTTPGAPQAIRVEVTTHIWNRLQVEEYADTALNTQDTP
ncbi:hypothetical protein ACWDUL_20305 [Nocardia niigatensis]